MENKRNLILEAAEFMINNNEKDIYKLAIMCGNNGDYELANFLYEYANNHTNNNGISIPANNVLFEAVMSKNDMKTNFNIWLDDAGMNRGGDHSGSCRVKVYKKNTDDGPSIIVPRDCGKVYYYKKHK